MDDLFHVVRAFDNPEVLHDFLDPNRDMDANMCELCRKECVQDVRAAKVADVEDA